MHKLTQSELDSAIHKLGIGWQVTWDGDDAKLHRQLMFPDFAAAFGFISQVALRAAKINHHPQWHNFYNQVDIYLMSHDAGGISDIDIKLATYINQVYDTLV